VFIEPEVINELERLHGDFVSVPADIACNNIVFVCKVHYYNCTLDELGISSSFGYPTYIPTALSKHEILQNHRSVLDTFKISINRMNEFELQYLYWIPILIHILTGLNEKLQTYCATTYGRSGVNQMWILKILKKF
jgi:hypothetical protein